MARFPVNPGGAVCGEVLDQAAEIGIDGPRGHHGAGVGRMRHDQRFDAVAPDAVVNAERQPVAIGFIGQPIEFGRTTVAVGWTAGFFGQPIIARWPACRFGRAAVDDGWPAGIVRRRSGFFGIGRSRRFLAGTGGRACSAALADADVRGRRSGRTVAEHGSAVTLRQFVGPARWPARWPARCRVAGSVSGPARAIPRPVARPIRRAGGRHDGSCGGRRQWRFRADHGRGSPRAD